MNLRTLIDTLKEILGQLIPESNWQSLAQICKKAAHSLSQKSYTLPIFIALGFVILSHFFRKTIWYFRIQAHKAGLNVDLTKTLERIVRRQHIRPATKVFKKSVILEKALKKEMHRLFADQNNPPTQEHVLKLYKIRQIFDLGDHSLYTLKSTKGLPVYKEIFILLGNYRLPAKIIKQKRKRFGLLIDLYSENRETCAQVRTIKVGMMCDLLFSGQIMEDFQFSARVASIYAADEQFLYLELTHTRSVNTVFYRRFRQKVVNIPNAYYCCIPYEGAATNNVLKLGKDIKPCSILRVSMDGCVLCVDGECIQGMRVAIMFRAFGRKCIYYGRMGKPFKEDEQQIQENCAEVQFTQSTVVGLINLGELVYGLGGWK